MGEPLGGHLVSGHVDGTVIRAENRAGGTRHNSPAVAPALLSDMVAKGSVAVDGVSLTLVDLNDRAGTRPSMSFPTPEADRAALLQPGDRVNLETDLIGKYVRAALSALAHSAAPAVTRDALEKAGPRMIGSPLWRQHRQSEKA